jgi:hypothetical protein
MTPIEPYARRGLWALPTWSILLFLATLTHQPPYKTEFRAWSRYVTTDSFLASHLVGSIAGAAFALLGFMALSVLLVHRGAPKLAVWALVTATFGDVAVVAVFGAAAFAQPAIGRAYLSGHAVAVPLYDDVNGTPLLVTALSGVLLLSTGLILYGVGVLRTRLVHPAAGWLLIVGGPLFAIVGVVLADVVQSVGAALLMLGTGWIALRAPADETDPLRQRSHERVAGS